MRRQARLIREARTRLRLAGWSVEDHEVQSPDGGTLWHVQATRGARTVRGEAETLANALAEVIIRAAAADAIAHPRRASAPGDPWRPFGAPPEG